VLFARYSSKVEAAGTRLRYSREYVIVDPDIGSDRFADLYKFENLIAEDGYASAVMKKVP